MITTAILQGLDDPPGAAIFRKKEKWDCEGDERPFAPRPRVYTEPRYINIVAAFNERFNNQGRDNQNEHQFATLISFF